MTVEEILTLLSVTPEPEPPEEGPHIVYEKDVKNPSYMDSLRGITAPVYWTTPAVIAIIEKIKAQLP